MMRFIIIFLSFCVASCNTKKESHTIDNIDSSGYKPQISTLNDTDFVKGNSVIFLRPDSIRFESYAREGDEIYEVDSDFGFAINGVIDSMENSPRFRNILVTISVKRFMSISDCKGCPILIDRDTIDYGTLFTGNGKKFQLQERHIFNTEGYLSEILDYFDLN